MSWRGYETTKEAGKRWGVSSMWVSQLCKQGRVPGAGKIGGIGILLQDQPVCLRRSTHSRHGLSPFVVDCPLRACVVDWRQKGGEYMTIKELDQRLTLVLEDFSSEMRSEYDDYSNEPVTGGDIAQLSRQTFYALDEFRKEIIKYLESNR